MIKLKDIITEDVQVLGYIRPAASFHTLNEWRHVVEQFLKLQQSGYDTRGGVIPSNPELIKLITEDAVELKEFGPFLESGSNAKNNTVWFPFASLKVTISNLLVKSNLPSGGNCESANSERVNNVRTAESLAQTRLVEEELGSYNLHHWFIIDLLWEKNDYEISATQAWNKFTELTRQEWLENPKQDKSWFKFRSHKQAKLVVMLNEKNDEKS